MICGDQCLKIFGFGESKELSPPGKPLFIEKLEFSRENDIFTSKIFIFYSKKSVFDSILSRFEISYICTVIFIADATCFDPLKVGKHPGHTKNFN